MVEWNVTWTQAATLQRYMKHAAFSFGQFMLQKVQGELLGPESGGPFVKRNVSEWIFGWQDPVVKGSLIFIYPRIH